VKASLDVKLKLKNSILSPELHGVDGQNRGVVVSFYEFRAADPELAVPRFDLMILHTAGRIGRGAIDKAELKGNRRGDIPHSGLGMAYIP
jgi:hypothetical protein